MQILPYIIPLFSPSVFLMSIMVTSFSFESSLTSDGVNYLCDFFDASSKNRGSNLLILAL